MLSSIWRTLPQVRWMTDADFREIVSSNAYGSGPRDEAKLIRLRVAYSCFTIDYRSEPVGYLAYELHSSGMTIHRFVVRDDRRRQSIGSHAVNWLKRKIAANQTLSIQVDEYNLAGQLFLRSQGFLFRCLIRDFSKQADIYLMEYKKPW